MITLEEFKKKQLDKSRLIGLDLGSKRIGVSICDEKQLIATPFKTINRTTAKDLINELKAEKLAGDLNSIFKFIEKLNELKTDTVLPLTSVAETTLKLRSDEIKSEDIRKQILKNSPQDNEDYFVVPKVIE